MRITVDAARCAGHALCAAVAEEVYQVNEDDGFNDMGEFEVPDTLAEAALRGLAACPERAVAIADAPDGGAR